MISMDSLSDKQQDDVRFAVYILENNLVSLENVNKSLGETTQGNVSIPLGMVLVRKRLITFEKFNEINNIVKKEKNENILENITISLKPDSGSILLETKNSSSKKPDTTKRESRSKISREPTASIKDDDFERVRREPTTAIKDEDINKVRRESTVAIKEGGDKDDLRKDSTIILDDQKKTKTAVEGNAVKLDKNGKLSIEELPSEIREEVEFGIELISRGLVSLDEINLALKEMSESKFKATLGVILARKRLLSVQDMFQIKSQIEAKKSTKQTSTGEEGIAVDITLDPSTKMLRLIQKSKERRFGKYKILREIARGGMGIVYEALDEKLGRRVALKTLIVGEHASPKDLERFKHEAQLAAGLGHPNIIPIHEIGEHEGIQYFTMDFIQGLTLSGYIKEAKPSLKETLAIIAKSAEALDFAHKHNVIHRDIKPANIMISAYGSPIVMDFGLAKDTLSQDHLTISGMAMGTPAYMAPEQAAGKLKDIGPHTDVYSLGAVLYEALVGRPPFTPTTLAEAIRQIREVEPVHPRKLSPGIPKDAETICLKCLEKSPGRRYASAQDMAEDINLFLSGKVIKARPASLGYRFTKWVKRNKLITAGIICSVLALAIGFGLGIYKDYKKRKSDIKDSLASIDGILNDDPWAKKLREEHQSPSITDIENSWDNFEKDDKDTVSRRIKRLRNYTDAISHCNSILRLEPDHDEANRLKFLFSQTLSFVACKSGDFDSALATIENIKEEPYVDQKLLDKTIARINELKDNFVKTQRKKIEEEAQRLANLREFSKENIDESLKNIGPLQIEMKEEFEKKKQDKNINVRRMAITALNQIEQNEKNKSNIEAIQKKAKRLKEEGATACSQEVMFTTVLQSIAYKTPLDEEINKTAEKPEKTVDQKPPEVRPVDEKRESVQKTVAPSPFDSEYDVAFQKYNRKEIENELKNLNEDIKYDARNHYAHYRRGMIRMKLGNLDEAVEDFGKAIDRAQKYAPYYQIRGLAYHLKKDLSKASQDMTEAIKLNPDEASYYADSALIHQKMNESPKALADISKAIELDSKNGKFYARRAWIYKENEQYNLALDDIARGLKLTPAYLPLLALRKNIEGLIGGEYNISTSLQNRELNEVIDKPSLTQSSCYLLGRGWNRIAQVKSNEKESAGYYDFYKDSILKLLEENGLSDHVRTRLNVDLGDICFEAACYYATIAKNKDQSQRQNDITTALSYLDLALKHNPNNVPLMSIDNRLQPLYEEEKYKSLVNEYRQK